ncbi:MAG: cell division protein FtsQ, partial [Paludibacteraceae bacterium]|nr:cell division protein FtsQ [Paludibacteraceae bacterium]
VYVPIVTGNVNSKFIKDKLFDFIVFLQNDKFLRSQIEQIHVCPNMEIELVPRVGQHIIYLGQINGYEEKLERLLIFYEKGLSQTGWNQYTGISLKYKDQVVCTKKKQ